MQIKQVGWPVKGLVKEQSRINLNPTWQRGAAWNSYRQVLLIDSILRGMDIPKVYLRMLPNGAIHGYDAVDGQQRLRAIWEFRAGAFPLTYLEPLQPIDGHPVAGLKFGNLHKTLQERFESFEVSVAEITNSTPDEITNLFSRLQMGVSLNPAELRNALGGPMRHVIDAIATSHQFFVNSRISGARYKRQDYAAHVFAMAAYGGQRDIKAPDLKRMVLEFGAAESDQVLALSAKVGDALNVIATVNELSSHRITQKWIFVDLCWLIMQRHEAGAVIDPAKLAAAYQAFEVRRRDYTSHADDLIRGREEVPPLDRHLYAYIGAFRAEGAVQGNLRVRNAALQAFCADTDGRA
jgi:hypothetical protein